MLNINQKVFTVCALLIAPNRHKIYISEKEINFIARAEDRSIVYTAGKHNELMFHAVAPGKYRSIESPYKRVFLNKEDAEREKSLRIKSELERRKKNVAA